MVTVEHPDPTLRHGICQAGSTRLQTYLIKLFGVGNSGCYNPNSVLTSGAPSFHVYGEAIDMGTDFFTPIGREKGNEVFDWAYNHREQLNLQQVIGGTRIWSSFDPHIRWYTRGDHNNHVHISLGKNAALNWNEALWVSDLPVIPKPVVPAPIKSTDETDDSMFWYDKFMHDVWIAANGDVQHIYAPASAAHPAGGVENLSKLMRKTSPDFGRMKLDSPVTFQVRPDSYGVAIDGYTIAENGWICHWTFDGNPIAWRCIPYPPA